MRFMRNTTSLCSSDPSRKFCDISARCREGRLKEAAGISHFTKQRHVSLGSETHASLLQECADKKSLAEGKRVHAHMLTSQIHLSSFLAAILVKMYANCGSLLDARLVFEKMVKRNAILWNAMIRGYAMNGHCEEALRLFYEMRRAGVHPDNFTFPCVLKACAALEDLQKGKAIHDLIIRCGFDSVVFIGNALVAMYAKCGSLTGARQVFDKMSQRDLVSWNAMIAGYSQEGHSDKALKLFSEMHLAGVKPDAITFASVLSACTQLAALEQGKEIHSYVIRSGCDLNVTVGNSLVAMYGRCASIENACMVFDNMSQKDAVSWNAMISGYDQNECCEKALDLFYQMQLSGVKPDGVTVATVLNACAHLAALKQGKEIHGYIIRGECHSQAFVDSALVDMYAKCGNIEDARQVFDKVFQKDIVSWTAMIAGYSENGYGEEALKLFHQMHLSGLEPDPVVISSILPACAHLAALQQGKGIHCYLTKRGFESNDFVGSALVDMYAKCGSVDDAHQVFDKISSGDVTSWTTMIAGYAMHGRGEDALRIFCQMQQACMKPDCITFIAVLSACNHTGLVDEGWKYFECMSKKYNITPSLEHHACMVDLLGRAGRLDDAYNFIETMPLKPNVTVWGALLGACRTHGNKELGEIVAQCLFELEPENTGNYVLLSNIYAAAGRWGEVEKVRNMMKDRGLKKRPGCSWIEIKNRVHAFLVGDRSHPQMEEICAMLESLSGRMEMAGYVPDLNFALHDV